MEASESRSNLGTLEKLKVDVRKGKGKSFFT